MILLSLTDLNRSHRVGFQIHISPARYLISLDDDFCKLAGPCPRRYPRSQLESVDRIPTTRKSRFSEERIIGILKEHQAGMSEVDLRHEHDVSDATLYT